MTETRTGGNTSKKQKVVNGVRVDNLRAFIEKVREDPELARLQSTVEGQWNDSGKGAMFTLWAETAGGKTGIKIDEFPFLGGTGVAPSPIQFCIGGAIACYANSFAKKAAAKGVTFTDMQVRGEGEMNISRSLGLSDEPILEGMKISIKLKTEASDEQLQEIKELADYSCPALYCLKNEIKVDTSVNT